MERQQLWALYQWMLYLKLPGPKGVRFSDMWIALVHLWSVLSDRPLSWACRAKNWPEEFVHFTPPSPTTMSRRLQSTSVLSLLDLALRRLNPPPASGTAHWVDGKPLAVGGATRDPDARAGRGAGMMAKGYKLHAMVACTDVLRGWAVEPLNVSEPKVALRFVPQLEGPCYLVGDHLFDWRVLYDAAGERAVQLLVSPERNGSPVPGVRHQSPYRLIGLKLAHQPRGQKLLRERFGIDRFFGQLGNSGGGMGPLPNWVRRLHRVRRWVAGKLIWFSFQRQLKNKELQYR
jgi:hypothetical protein